MEREVRRKSFTHQKTLLFIALGDVFLALIAYGSAFLLRIYLPLPLTADYLPATRMWELHHPLIQILLSQLVLLYFFGLYDLREIRQNFHLFLNATAASFIQVLTIMSWFFFSGDLFFPRSVLVLYWAINAMLVAGFRLEIVEWLRKARPKKVLLVGAPEDLQSFVRSIPDLLHFPGFHIVGVVGLSGQPTIADSAIKAPWLGTADDLPHILRTVEVEDIILLSPASWRDQLLDSLIRLPAGGRNGRPRVAVVPSVYDILVGRVSSLRLHDIPLIEVVKNPREDLAFTVKGVVDFSLGMLLFLLSLPLLLVAAVLIKLTSSGPVLYRQRRVGKDGKEFVMYKLRTMVSEAERGTGPVLAQEVDDRVTWIGRILRATRIDEIPQLLNVLNGTMSLIGPRPERPEFVEHYVREIPGYSERFQVKPGVTGLAQVNGEYHTTPHYKLKYDLAYIYNHSLLLDLKIMAETVKVVLTRRGV